MMVTRTVKLQDQSSPSSKRFYLIYLSICVHRHLGFINIAMYTLSLNIELQCRKKVSVTQSPHNNACKSPMSMCIRPSSTDVHACFIYKYGVSSIDSCYCIFVDNDGDSNIHMSIWAWGKVRQKIGKCAMRYAIKYKGLCDRLCDETYHHLPKTAWESCFYPKFSA